MTAQLFTGDLLPKSSEEYLRQFKEDYLMSISMVPSTGWADPFVSNQEAPRATFPLALWSSFFKETRDEGSTFRTMQEKSFDVKVVEFDDGYEAPLLMLQNNSWSYRNWSRAPEGFRIGESRHVAVQLAALLEAGTSLTSPWDDVAFFSTSHLANPTRPDLGTWSNYQSSATQPDLVSSITAEATAMRKVMDLNGRKLYVEPDEIWVPTDKFQLVTNLIESERLANGASNPIYGKFTVRHIPELTNTSDWYLYDSKLAARGVDPMVAAKYQPADTLGLRMFSEDSDYFKNTGNVKVSCHIWYGFHLVFPHAIRKIVGT